MLDDPAPAHDRRIVRNEPNASEIVADDEQRHTRGGGNVLEQVEKIALHGHIKPGGRLVGDHVVRLEQQHPGDSGPPGLTTAELVGVAIQNLRCQTQPLQKLPRPVARDGARLAQGVVDLVQRLPDTPVRRERLCRILEDRLDQPRLCPEIALRRLNPAAPLPARQAAGPAPS